MKEKTTLESYLDINSIKKKRNLTKTKICTLCRKRKPISNFYRSKRSSDGHSPHCKDCSRRIQKKCIERHRRMNKNRKNIYNNSKKKCASCGVWKIRSPENYATDSSRKDGLYCYCRECNKPKRKEIDLKTQYGISLKEYKEMLRFQRNRCKICGKKLEKPHVDHSHKNGDIRGLLCRKCNTGLGSFKDNPLILIKAIKYLRGEL